jgi:hypothetical protein
MTFLFWISGWEEKRRPDWKVTRVLLQIPNSVEFFVDLDLGATIVLPLKVWGNINLGDKGIGCVNSEKRRQNTKPWQFL